MKTGVVKETPGPTNNYNYKVVLLDGDVQWVVSPRSFCLEDLVNLTYTSTSSGGWYVMTHANKETV